MKHVIAAAMLFLSFRPAVAEELPTEFDLRRVTLPSVAQGKSLTLDYTLDLPETQKLNAGAPSFVAVYEKTQSGWTKIAGIKLNEVFTLGEKVELRKQIILASDTSEIAVHSTIYHCGANAKTACYIQAFQGKANRSENASQSIPFVAKATMSNLGR